MAQQSLETQRQQNEMIARQSQTVAEQSSKLAEASRSLVAEDAKARNEILAAQRDLQDQATVMEDDRRDLMQLRIREPIIAEAIKSIGGVLLCLVPLSLVGMLLWPQRRGEVDNAVLNRLLLQEFAGTSSLLLEKSSLPNLPPPPDQPLLPQSK
jgi:cbb3-type cytochrome oxidase subunit 3